MLTRSLGLAVIAQAALWGCSPARSLGAGDAGGAARVTVPGDRDQVGEDRAAAPPAGASGSAARSPTADASPSGAPSSQSDPAAAVPASILTACGACQAGVLRLRIDDHGVAVGDQQLPPDPRTGHRQSVDPAALQACLTQCSGSKLAVSARGGDNACLVGDLLRAAAAFGTATLEVDARQAGTYSLSAGKSDLELTSMMCGPRTNVSAWISDVARLDGVTAPKNIKLTVNYGCTLREVMPTLRAVSGKGLALGCHMGPF